MMHKARYQALGHLLDTLVDPAVKGHGTVGSHANDPGHGTLAGTKTGLSQGHMEAAPEHAELTAEEPDEDDVMGRFKKIMGKK